MKLGYEGVSGFSGPRGVEIYAIVCSIFYECQCLDAWIAASRLEKITIATATCFSRARHQDF